MSTIVVDRIVLGVLNRTLALTLSSTLAQRTYSTVFVLLLLTLFSEKCDIERERERERKSQKKRERERERARKRSERKKKDRLTD